jgi:hypothetical protein
MSFCSSRPSSNELLLFGIHDLYSRMQTYIFGWGIYAQRIYLKRGHRYNKEKNKETKRNSRTTYHSKTWHMLQSQNVQEIFCSSKRPGRLWKPHSRGVKLTTHFHVVPRIWMELYLYYPPICQNGVDNFTFFLLPAKFRNNTSNIPRSIPFKSFPLVSHSTYHSMLHGHSYRPHRKTKYSTRTVRKLQSTTDRDLHLPTSQLTQSAYTKRAYRYHIPDSTVHAHHS